MTALFKIVPEAVGPADAASKDAILGLLADRFASVYDLDRDIVREAIFFDGFQEDSLADQNHEIIFPLLLTSQQLIARSALISASILRASPRVNDVVVEPPREIERLPF